MRRMEVSELMKCGLKYLRIPPRTPGSGAALRISGNPGWNFVKFTFNEVTGVREVT